jgi:predicted NAD-dependent protein-ADP-ribosyltransferase YbiA (DUF1768 family)
MTEILKPFDPFSMMMDRPIPKPFLALAKAKEELEEGEIDESEGVAEGEQEVEESQEIIETKEVPIVLSKNPEFDRDQKIEDLRKKKILITRCDIPEPFPTDTSFESDAAFLAEEEKDEKSKGSLEEGEIEEDSEDEESLEKTPEKPEEPYSLEAVQKITDLFDPEIVFVICSEAKDEKLPGKGAGKEVLPEDKKGEYIPNLAQHKEWRKKLCNAWVQPFSITIVTGNESKIFQSVDHFLHYSEFSEAEDLTLRDLLLEDAEKGAEIVKEKKYKGKKIVSNADWEETKYDKMYLALHAKFSQHTDLVPILVATKNAKLMYRETHVKQRPFYELMWLRRQYLNRGDTFLAIPKKEEGREEEGTEEKVKGKKREKNAEGTEIEGKKEKKEKQPIDLHLTEDKALEKVRLGVWEARLPKQTEQVSKKILRMPFYMTNRKKFIQNLNDMFADYRTEVALETDESNISCKQLRELGSTDSNKESLFLHQRVVRDYLNLYTPYRGVLLYHSLGSGKTKSSIAIAEGFKTDKKIFVMMPASLKTNYWVELSKAGDPLYKRNQFWEFVPITSQKYADLGEQMIPMLAKALSLSTDEIRKRKGAWMVDVNKPANFDQLSPENQAAVEAQIQEMISHKYVDIHYNAPNLKKIVDAMKAQNNGANPFDHSVVIIDEAHNFVSRIVNKLKTPASIFSQLYHLLMDAVDCRLVLLSGTPIINYPNELGVMFNLLRGYIKTWTFKVVTTTTKEVNQNAILAILEKYGLRTFDFVEYANNKLILTRNPFSFSNTGTYGSLYEPPLPQTSKARPKAETKKKRSKGSNEKSPKNITKKKSSKGGSRELVGESTGESTGGVGAEMKNYSGVKHEGPYMDDNAFIKTVIEAMEENGISLKPFGNAKSVFQPSLQKALYDDPDKFRETFIQETATIDKNALLNINVLRNRILGLTSYFRSAQEKLLPTIIPDEETGKEFHLVEVPMSDYQFSKYAKIRKEEYEKEDAAAKRKRMAPKAPAPGAKANANGVSTADLFNIASSYRIFSRAACNFIFPEGIERPRPPSKKGSKADGAEVEGTEGPGLEEAVEGIEADGSPVLPLDTSDKEEEIDVSYEKKIMETMQKLETQSKDIFSRESLGNYSPKFLEMVKRIQDPENVGLHLLYSNFRTLEGIGIFELVLKENGMEEFRIKKVGGVWTIDMQGEEKQKKRFTLYTGTESDEQKEIIRNIYNGSWETLSQEMRETLEKMDTTGKKNADGLIIQVFMITAAGAEGINLRNTRFVHIMEPYWHHVRLEQVIGRARRICSHEDLPEEQRTVKVFVYLSVMSTEQKTSGKYTELRMHDVSKIDVKKPVTTDENLYEIAQLKLKINQQFLRVIKETAMDCSLYVSSHNKQERVPLVCYGFGKVTTNEFSSHPILETDLNNTTNVISNEGPGAEGQGLPEGKAQGLREEKWKGAVVEIAGIKYAMNPNTNEVYNLANYNTGVLTFEGILQGRNFVPASEIKNRPQMILQAKEKVAEKGEKKSKSLDYLDITKKPFIEVAENSLYVESIDNKCNFIVFEPPGLKPTLFPFITNEKQLNLLVKASTAISPDAAPYEAKYNTEKYNAPVYQNIDKKSIGLTIDYIFNKMKTGVFVRIINNTLVNFQVLYNLDFTNDFADLLKFKNGMSAADYFKEKYPKGNAAKRYNTDLSKWNATNCLLRNELGDDIPTLAYLTVFYDMIVETCHARKVNDCVFLLNRKDFPYLDAKGNESYDHIYGDDVPMKAPYASASFIPILSQSTTERHADIPIPTGDDWEMITQKKFAGRGNAGFECANGYLLPKEGKEEQKKIPKWEDRKPVFFWRGMATGCGSDANTNPRLKITKLSQSLSQDRKESKGGAKDKPILDAGIVNFTRRDKKFKNAEYVEYMEKSADITILEKVERFDQTRFKFNINIEGNSAAYRFGSLFRLGFCVLNVVSKYTLWFEPFLQDKVHCVFVKSDLSDLEEMMEWCVANDAKCKEIAENGRKFYDRYFNKEFVFDYLADVFNKTSSLLNKSNDTPVELVPYATVIKPEMDNYKKRYTVRYETFKMLKPSTNTSGKTILIVPFRENRFQNRAEQLENFIRAYAPKEGPKASGLPILIVTQSDDGRGFNRGALLNIGFDFLARSSKDRGSFDSFIMHDVDLVFPPEFVEKYYGSAASGSAASRRQIIHYGKTIKGYYDYDNFLGGAIEFSRNAFERINGFPNHIYGWGGEDDALKVRIASVGSTVYRPDEMKQEAMLALAPGQAETKDIPELVAKYKNEDLLLDESIWKINGLNSLHYTVLEETMKTVGVYQIVVSIQ